MRKRNVVFGAVAVAGAYFVIKGVFMMGKELQRYDKIRAMSNEGPVLEETPEMLNEIRVKERQWLFDWVAFFKMLPKDIARYMKIESM